MTPWAEEGEERSKRSKRQRGEGITSEMNRTESGRQTAESVTISGRATGHEISSVFHPVFAQLSPVSRPFFFQNRPKKMGRGRKLGETWTKFQATIFVHLSSRTISPGFRPATIHPDFVLISTTPYLYVHTDEGERNDTYCLLDLRIRNVKTSNLSNVAPSSLIHSILECLRKVRTRHFSGHFSVGLR